MHDTINDAFDKLFQEHLAKLKRSLEEVFDGLYAKFNLLCDDTTARNESEKHQEEKLINELRKAVIKARELVEGTVFTLANECKDYAANAADKEENSLFVE